MGVILAILALDAVHVGVDNLNVVRHGGRLVDALRFFVPLSWTTTVTLWLSFGKWLIAGVTVRLAGRVREVDRVVGMTGLMRLLTVGVGEPNRELSMLGVTFLVSVVVGILLFSNCIVFHCYFSCCSEY